MMMKRWPLLPLIRGIDHPAGVRTTGQCRRQSSDSDTAATNNAASFGQHLHTAASRNGGIALTKWQQTALDKLYSITENGLGMQSEPKLHSGRLPAIVACCIGVAPPDCVCGGHVKSLECTCPKVPILGLNYEAHRRINSQPRSQPRTRADHASGSASCPSTGAHAPRLLKGLLKGCAEQNALGAVAAQGYPFHCIRDIIIVGTYDKQAPSSASPSSCSHCTEGPGKKKGRGAAPPIGDGPILPCPECQTHLQRVANIVHDFTRLRLNLVVGGSHWEQRSSRHSQVDEGRAEKSPISAPSPVDLAIHSLQSRWNVDMKVSLRRR